MFSIIIEKLIFSALSTLQIFLKPPNNKVIRSFYNIFEVLQCLTGEGK